MTIGIKPDVVLTAKKGSGFTISDIKKLIHDLTKNCRYRGRMLNWTWKDKGRL
jgi:hypothetical protein